MLACWRNDPRASPRGARAPFMNTRANPLAVYVVEDSEILTKLLVTMLRADLGVEVVGNSGDATTAIAEIRELHPDVIIVDLVLRTGNGFEVLNETRTFEHAPTPVVLTNHSTATYREAARKLGVPDAHYFDKTEQIGSMCALIRRMSEERRPSQ